MVTEVKVSVYPLGCGRISSGATGASDLTDGKITLKPYVGSLLVEGE